MIVCKCGASTYKEHVKKAEEGYPGHTYRGIGAVSLEYCRYCNEKVSDEETCPYHD